MEDNQQQWISSFWRRIGAALVDILLLGTVGAILGLFFSSVFIEMGAWGRLVGLAIALAYFGVGNSRLFDGQTFGKRLLKIKVVDRSNHCISLPRSILRYLILAIPFYLNGLPVNGLSGESGQVFWTYVLSFLVFGMILSLLYLYIFNRNTRQSLHDLIFGTYVVYDDVDPQPIADFWQPHYRFVGAILGLALVLPYIAENLVQSEAFEGMSDVQAAVLAHPTIEEVGVSVGFSTRSAVGKDTITVHYLSVVAKINSGDINDSELAKLIAEQAAALYPNASEKDVVTVTFVTGYDIGIFSSTEQHTHSFEI